MDELIAWIQANKEWAFSGVGVLFLGGIFGIFKWLFKKPSSATVSNTATTGSIAADTIHVGAQVNVNAIVQQLLEAHGKNIKLEQELAIYRQQNEEAVAASSDEWVGSVEAHSVELDMQMEAEPGPYIARLSSKQEAEGLQLQQSEDQIKQLTEAVAALAAQRGKPDAPLGLEHALAELENGNTEEAEAIFQTIVDRKEPDIQQAAEAYRHIGALAFLHDTNKALDAYRRATELDPGNGEGWNQYGHLLRRVGKLKDAEKAYREVLRLGQSNNDKALVAKGYRNLGIVYSIRGDLEQAEAMHRKSLAIDKALGRKEGMARDYGNLGLVYQGRGDLDQAEAMHKKALAINKTLGRKEGMANAYGNLGNMYQTRGDLDQAEAMYEKSLAIEEALGRKEGMASSYGGLGLVYKKRGELDQAEAMLKKSVLLYREIGAVPREKQVQEMLDSLVKERALPDSELTE